MNVFDEIQAIIDSRDSCYCPECRKDKATAIRQAVASDLRRRALVITATSPAPSLLVENSPDVVIPFKVASELYRIADEYEKGE